MTDLMECFLKEYEKLKDEQIQRIGFRDNLIYVTLVAVGAVFSYSLAAPENRYALLILPLVCFVLGWVYLQNDDKISAIGAYIEGSLIPQISAGLPDPAKGIFGWEQFHKSPVQRNRYKAIQLLVDLAMYILPGLCAIGIFWLAQATVEFWPIIVSIVEGLALLLLGREFLLIYATNIVAGNAAEVGPDRTPEGTPDTQP